MGAVLLAAGAKGKRYALPHSHIMLHQPSGGAGGQSTDIQIHAREIVRMRESLNAIISKHSGRPLDEVTKKTERDLYLNAEEALEFGVIDEILHPKKA